MRTEMRLESHMLPAPNSQGQGSLCIFVYVTSYVDYIQLGLNKQKIVFPRSMDSGDGWLMVLVQQLHKGRGDILDPFALISVLVTSWSQDGCCIPKNHVCVQGRRGGGRGRAKLAGPVTYQKVKPSQKSVSCSLPLHIFT
uniref:Uncharacterized protein n=1 Tax=Mandrillus leucophaeus TaxID=9568 RepID=A0A2K5YVK5_MANLE